MARALGGVILALALATTPAQALELGRSGLDVTVTPQSLVIRTIAPYSPAWLARVPHGGGLTARLAFVNGEDAYQLYREGRLQEAFATGSVMVAVALRAPQDLGERLTGPHELVLKASPRQRAMAALDESDWATAADLAASAMLEPDMALRVWGRLAQEARTLGLAGQWRAALAVADRLPADQRTALAPQRDHWHSQLEAQLRDDRALSPRERHLPGRGPVLLPPMTNRGAAAPRAKLP